MNDLQLRAYGCVAQAMARLVHEMAAADESVDEKRTAFRDEPGPIFYHYSMSIFEMVAHDLWRLRILRPLDQKRDWAYHFVFACELSDSDKVAERCRRSTVVRPARNVYQSFRRVRLQMGHFDRAQCRLRRQQPHPAGIRSIVPYWVLDKDR